MARRALEEGAAALEKLTERAAFLGRFERFDDTTCSARFAANAATRSWLPRARAYGRAAARWPIIARRWP